MVKFENLDTPKGQQELNKHLTERSYIQGFTPSADDNAVFQSCPASIDETKVPHAARWWNHINSFSSEERSSWKAPAPEKEDKTDDFDLFGEDAEDADWESQIQERADAHAAKKAATGKKVIMKSAVVVDVKPWDDATDMAVLEKHVREIQLEGLEWKASKLIPMAFGIKKLAISCHIVDDLVSMDDIQEKIQELEDFVQSTDIASFTKL